MQNLQDKCGSCLYMGDTERTHEEESERRNGRETICRNQVPFPWEFSAPRNIPRTLSFQFYHIT